MAGSQFKCDADAAAIARMRRAELGDNPSPAIDRGSVERAVAETRYWVDGLGRPCSLGNAVIAYGYGVCAFADMGDALATAKTASDRIYLLGWWVRPDTPMKAGNGGLLSDILSGTKAEIRGMFWANKQNDLIKAFLTQLPNGAVILDSKLPLLTLAGQQFPIRGGVHHQKLLVVSGSSGLIAFAGGMDINSSRVNRTPGGFEPLHDVHVRIIGKEAASLLTVFQERWLDHPDSAQLDQTKFNKTKTQVTSDFAAAKRNTPNPDLPTSTISGGGKNNSNFAVAVGRTYADLTKFNKNEVYGFAPKGDETGWSIVQHAIQRAKSFIYIEDQYFVSRRLKAELLKKLQDPNFEMLLVLTERSSSFESSPDLIRQKTAAELKKEQEEREQAEKEGTEYKEPDPELANEFPYLIAARNEVRADFLSVDPKQAKWRLFNLKASTDAARQQVCGSYVHSKTMLIDDDFAVIGSANVDDRGYTFDTEIVLGITDDPAGRADKQKFARNLRIDLWHKHLGVPHGLLINWRESLKYWLSPPFGSMIVDSSGLEDSPMLGPKAVLRKFSKADRFWSESVDPDADKLPLP